MGFSGHPGNYGLPQYSPLHQGLAFLEYIPLSSGGIGAVLSFSGKRGLSGLYSESGSSAPA
jgi:hypothetical protein